MKNDGLLIVFSGPSGAGKDTILKRLLETNADYRLSVSATTRAPREGEVDGKDYHFITKEKFQNMLKNDELLESAEYCGNCYGTPSGPIRSWQAEGHDVILEIEVQGGSQIKTKCPDCVSIFILPPSMEVLEQRLRGRGTEADEVIQKRMMRAQKEIEEAVHYDYCVINDTVEKAVDEINQIICAEKHKVYRNADFIERMLNHA
ncbi:guanylate kinase [Caproiciproducens sp. LBM24188]|nr:guanylate kinase [Oscillospiraceae bacterium]HHV31703.1 guanylate kinase [Clostridiales bacterium]